MGVVCDSKKRTYHDANSMFIVPLVAGANWQKEKERFTCYTHLVEEGLWCEQHRTHFVGFKGFGNACPECVEARASEVLEERVDMITSLTTELPEPERARVTRHLKRRGVPENALPVYLARRSICANMTVDELISHALATKSANAILPLGAEELKQKTVRLVARPE